MGRARRMLAVNATGPEALDRAAKGDLARKPNYRFERFERERTRAAKKAARAQAKADKKAKASDAPGDHDAAAGHAAPADRDPDAA